jgi:hypothetical protein
MEGSWSNLQIVHGGGPIPHALLHPLQLRRQLLELFPALNCKAKAARTMDLCGSRSAIRLQSPAATRRRGNSPRSPAGTPVSVAPWRSACLAVRENAARRVRTFQGVTCWRAPDGERLTLWGWPIAYSSSVVPRRQLSRPLPRTTELRENRPEPRRLRNSHVVVQSRGGKVEFDQ